MEEYAAPTGHPTLGPGAVTGWRGGRVRPPGPQQKEPAPARLVVDLGKDLGGPHRRPGALLRALPRGGTVLRRLGGGRAARRGPLFAQVRQWVAEAGRRFTTLVELKETVPTPRG